MKIKVYLDTNIILDLFINHAKALRKGEEAVLPKKYEFMLASKEKVEFVTSFLTKAEAVRELVSAYNVFYKDFLIVWRRFIDSLECKYIENFEFDKKIVEIVAKAKIRLRTMFNFMHLFIAISLGAYFISGDKDAVIKSRKLDVYDKAVTYEEFRKMMGGGL